MKKFIKSFLSIVLTMGIFQTSLFASEDVIELQDKGVKYKVRSVDGQPWYSYKLSLDDDKKKGILGEQVAKAFFQSKGYTIIEEYRAVRKKRLVLLRYPEDEIIYTDMSCTSKKGPDNGIDGIFICTSDSIESPTHVIINEAKFRLKGKASTNDFGFVKKLNDSPLPEGKYIQQSHSKWNRQYFDRINCLNGLKYDGVSIIRTATVLGDNGELRIYLIRDKSDVASEEIIRGYVSENKTGDSVATAEEFIASQAVESTFSVEFYKVLGNEDIMPILKELT